MSKPTDRPVRHVKLRLPARWAQFMRYAAALGPGRHMIELEIPEDWDRPAWRQVDADQMARRPSDNAAEREPPRAV